jgi:hypothetical protein
MVERAPAQVRISLYVWFQLHANAAMPGRLVLLVAAHRGDG